MSKETDFSKITFDMMPKAISFLISEIAELKKLVSNTTTNPQANPSPQTDIIFLNEVCKITNLSKATLYCLSSAGKIPIIKPEGTKKLMFSRVAINNWLLNSRQIETNKI